MDCPRDGTRLEEVKIEDVVVDRCPGCGGVWIDFGVMARVLSRDSHDLRMLLPQREAPEMPEEEYLECPRCDDVLIRMESSEAGLEYYSCLTCYGRWLDGKTLDGLAERSLLLRFEKLFERLLH